MNNLFILKLLIYLIRHKIALSLLFRHFFYFSNNKAVTQHSLYCVTALSNYSNNIFFKIFHTIFFPFFGAK